MLHTLTFTFEFTLTRLHNKAVWWRCKIASSLPDPPGQRKLFASRIASCIPESVGVWTSVCINMQLCVHGHMRECACVCVSVECIVWCYQDKSSCQWTKRETTVCDIFCHIRWVSGAWVSEWVWGLNTKSENICIFTHTHTHLNRHSSYMQLKCNTHTQIGTCMYILTYDYILIILKMWCRSPNNKKEAPTTSHNKYFICMHIRTNVHTHMPSHTNIHTHT